ncbi:unnamed protein product [Dicrocoelium dendriticum]|nr:unnamed protein product [Dicrocoelium dendriticum]
MRVLFLLCGLFLTVAIDSTGRHVLREEDFGREHSRQLLDIAVRECNRYDNDPFWSKLESILEGTKRHQVNGIVEYRFKLRLRVTNCPLGVLLSENSKQPEYFCDSTQDPYRLLCTVRVREHVEEGRKPEITVDSVWHWYPEKEAYTATFKMYLSKRNQSKEMHRKLLQLVDHYNLVNNTSRLLRYADFDEGFEQGTSGGTTTGTVYLHETQCDRSTEVAENENSKMAECFNNLTGNVVTCQVTTDEENKDATRLNNCVRNSTVMRGLWRSTKPQSKPRHKCFPITEQWKFDEEDPSQDIQMLSHVGRSNIRAVDPDELQKSPFKEILQDTVTEYNKRVNEAFMYSLHRLDNVKIEIEPKMVLSFSMTVQLTNCHKTDELVDNVMKFQEQCREPAKPPKLQLCHVVVTGGFATDEDNRSYSFQGCRSTKPSSRLRVGHPRHMDPKERESEEFKRLVERVVSYYNNRSDSNHVYSAEDVRNTSSQIVSGRRITMTITMKAIGCKETLSACLLDDKEVYRYCEVRVIQQPWVSLEMIDVTNCWERTKMMKEIEGTWEIPSPDYMSRPEVQSMINTAVAQHNKLFNDSNITTLDYITEFQKLKVGEKQMYTFILHLKGGTQDRDIRVCNVLHMGPSEGNEGQVFVTNCSQKQMKPVKMLVGKPRLLTDDERDTEEFLELTNRVTSKFNQLTEDTHYHRLVHIVNATVQVVAGKLTVLHIHLQRTKCNKTQSTRLFDTVHDYECGIPNQTHVLACRARVWSKPWEDFEEITVEGCQEIPLKTPIYVQTKQLDFMPTRYFKHLMRRAEHVFNLASDQMVFFETHLVENFEFKHSGNREYKFTHILKPTRCVKWTGAAYFFGGQADVCLGLGAPIVASCETSVKRKGNTKASEDLIMKNCQYFRIGEFIPRRAMTAPERVSAEFTAIVDRSVNIFNTRTYSVNWHTLFNIEHPTVEYIAGKQIAFTLFLLPTLCRSPTIMKETEVSDVISCNSTTLRYVAACKVRYWTRPWSKEHETIDVNDCVIVPVENVSLSNGSTVMQPGESSYLMECLQSLQPKLRDTFGMERSMYFDFGSTYMDNIEQQTVAGKRFIFDLFLKPKAESTNCSLAVSSSKPCPKEISFYHCKASIWLRPWQETVTYDLVNCVIIVAKINGTSAETTLLSGSEYDEELEEIAQRAVHLYNNNSSGGTSFGLVDLSNVVHQMHFGIKTTFNLKMKPIDCSQKDVPDGCHADETQPSVRCLVTNWHRPWMLGMKRLILSDCQVHSGPESSFGVRPLSSQERNSAQFQEMLGKLVRMYKPSVPILYDVDTIEDAQVELNEQFRNVSFTLGLKPSGCNDTLPNADSLACKKWQQQDIVNCNAYIVERPPFGQSIQLYLRNCHIRWVPQSRRLISSEEKMEPRFQNSVDAAWNIYAKINPDNELYAVSDITDATIEVKSVSLINSPVFGLFASEMRRKLHYTQSSSPELIA